MMVVVQDLIERLRPLVGFKGWDYCVLWKLTDNQRYIEWMGCCCGGADQSTQYEELRFPVSQVHPCRDVMFHHPTSLSCELLSQLPSSVSLDSAGIHAQALISNSPKWLNFSPSSDSGVGTRDTIGTRTLIPVAGGLVELFVAKQVVEDQNVIEFVTAQCNFLVVDGEATMINPTNSINISTSISISSSNNVVGDEQYPEHQPSSFLAPDNNGMSTDQQLSHFHPPISPDAAALGDQNPINLPFDMSVDRIRLCSSPMNFLQQFHYGEAAKSRINDDHDQFLEEGDHHDHDHDHQMNGVALTDSIGDQKEEQGHSTGGMSHMEDGKDQFGGENVNNARMGSTSDCSDQVDDHEEEYGKCHRKKGGKGQAKNLQAERRRRKKLNERLYALRTLVPNITKLDKASILGDAISFVKDLQRQAKELQDELEEPSDGEGNVTEGNNQQLHGLNLTQDASLGPNGADHFGSRPAFGFPGISSNGSGNCKHSSHEVEAAPHDKGQQMEPQVEVAQIDGNKFFVKVFCEFKAGGFVRLMEALNSLGFVVTNANVTRVLSLVSNVFQVEKKDMNELVQADYVRESLLELTRNSKGWPDKASESCSNVEYAQHHHHHLHDAHVNSHYQHHHHHHNGAA